MADDLELTTAERDRVLLDRANAEAGKIDISIIKPGISREDLDKVRRKINELWK